MKKKIIRFAIVVLILAIAAGIVYINRLYPETAIVVDIEDGVITAICANGNMFEFFADDGDWCNGDICAMIMYDNGTESVIDDRIISVKYAGYMEAFAEFTN